MFARYRYLFLTIGIVLAAFLAPLVFALTVGGYSLENAQHIEEVRAHFYDKPEVSLERVAVKVVYVVPADIGAKASTTGWSSKVEEKLHQVMNDVAVFHRGQFRGSSVMNYEFFPWGVTLRRESRFYDSDNTNEGNPHALTAIAAELQERMFTEGGDLYDAEFSKYQEEEYRVLALVYAGVGASGGAITKDASYDGALILNQDYFLDERWQQEGPTVLYHELAHTLGVPDSYDIKSGVTETDDIMGSRRDVPLANTYLDLRTLKHMGVGSE